MENKWWEYYAVRYFVGTVVGASIVAYFLNNQLDSPYKDILSLGKNSEGVTFLGFSAVAAAGFAYCYIASSPVLTLHIMRAHLRFSELQSSWFWCFVCSVFAIAAAFFILPPLAAIGAGLVIGFQVGLILLAFFDKFSVIEKFYRGLADTRSKAMIKKENFPTAGHEYMTSYRHMREHGNAFMIVILEGVFAYILFYLPSAAYGFYFIFIWLLPATLAWLMGTLLESRFVTKSLP